MQRQFVSDVSHELRTPLTTVRMAADLLLRGPRGLRARWRPARPSSCRASSTGSSRCWPTCWRSAGYDAGAATSTSSRSTCATSCCAPSATPRRWPSATATRLELRLPTEPCMAEVRPAGGSSASCATCCSTRSSTARAGDIVVTLGADRDAVAVAVRDHGVGPAAGRGEHGLRPLLAGRPVAGPHHRRHRPRAWRSPARTRMLHGGWLQAWGAPGEGTQFRLSLPRTAGTLLQGVAAAAGAAGGRDAPRPGAGTSRRCCRPLRKSWGCSMSTKRVLTLVATAATLTACTIVPTSGNPPTASEEERGGDILSQTYVRILAQPPRPRRDRRGDRARLPGRDGQLRRPPAQGRPAISRPARRRPAGSRGPPRRRSATAASPTTCPKRTPTSSPSPSRAEKVATLEKGGRYRATASEETVDASFTLIRVNGEWRISEAPAGLILHPQRPHEGLRPRGDLLPQPELLGLVADRVRVPIDPQQGPARVAHPHPAERPLGPAGGRGRERLPPGTKLTGIRDRGRDPLRRLLPPDRRPARQPRPHQGHAGPARLVARHRPHRRPVHRDPGRRRGRSRAAASASSRPTSPPTTRP